MNKYFLIAMLSLPLSCFSQSKWVARPAKLAPIAFENKMATMQVVDKLGNPTTLATYFSKNKKHSDKPVLILLFGVSGKGLNNLKDIAEDQLGLSYNVIALYIGWGKEITANMNSFLEKNEIKSSWDQFLLLSTSYAELKASTGVEVFPRQIFTTQNLEVVASTELNPEENVKIMLDAIDAGLTKKDKIWYNKEGHITNASNDDALYYEQNQLKPGYIGLITGTTNEILSKETFHIVEDQFLQDDVLFKKNLEGVILETGKFKDGVPIDSVKTFYENGKTRSITPVNGILKDYDENGLLETQGPIVNGLGNGVFNSYSEGEKTATYNYRMGELSGIQQRFSDDVIVEEWFASSEYDDVGYLSEGLQVVKKNKKYGYTDRAGKTIIPFIYDLANFFRDGKAYVKLNGEFFNIDKNGKRVE